MQSTKRRFSGRGSINVFIWTVGRGKKRRAHSLGFGSANKQACELMCITKYIKKTTRYMVNVAHEAFNIEPIPMPEEKEEA